MKNGALRDVRDVYQALLELIQREGPAGDVSAQSIDYIAGQIRKAISILDDAISQHGRNGQNMRTELVDIYNSITRPRIGINDYFVWRDDFDERTRANDSLEELKERLRSIHAVL